MIINCTQYNTLRTSGYTCFTDLQSSTAHTDLLIILILISLLTLIGKFQKIYHYVKIRSRRETEAFPLLQVRQEI